MWSSDTTELFSGPYLDYGVGGRSLGNEWETLYDLFYSAIFIYFPVFILSPVLLPSQPIAMLPFVFSLPLYLSPSLSIPSVCQSEWLQSEAALLLFCAKFPEVSGPCKGE